jgi:hypothetical protein
MTVDNIPNLNVDELSAYASAKHLSGVSDEEIQESIIRMLRDDGWKDAAITPMISEIARRTKGVAETKGSPRSPPKASQDATAAIMTRLLEMLTPLTARLNVLEQQQTAQKPQVPTPGNPAITLPNPQQLYDAPRHQPKFPHPELFDGDRPKYAAFRYKTKAKLRNEYDRLSDEAKISYVVSRCTERASDVILPWAEQNQDRCSIGDLWVFLDQQYDDPHLKSKALDQLSSLRQGKRSVRDYHMEFNRLELQSGERFGDASRKNMFLKGLNPKLQETLATIDDNLSFELFVNKATRTSDNLYRVNLNNKRREESSRPLRDDQRQNEPSSAQSPETMDWEPTKVNKAHPTERRSGKPQFECYNCGEKGHIARKCSNPPKAKNVRANRAAEQQPSSNCKCQVAVREAETDSDSDNTGKE